MSLVHTTGSHLTEISELRCIGCGCTDELPCVGQSTDTGTCFWTWGNEVTGKGLCSACAEKPVEELQKQWEGIAA